MELIKLYNLGWNRGASMALLIKEHGVLASDRLELPDIDSSIYDSGYEAGFNTYI